jgi:protein-S-isoprenylcysteine O-methyltransferase Ste14
MLALLIPFRPREARPATRAWNTVKTLGQIVVMWSVILGLLPMMIVSIEHTLGLSPLPRLRGIGMTLLLIGSLLGLVTANVMVRDGAGTPLPLDTARNLVVSGPYRYVRNPMAIFGFVQGLGVGLWLGSLGVLVYTVIGAAIWQWVARPWEEADLEIRFADRYRRYRSAVPCWIPRYTAYWEANDA